MSNIHNVCFFFLIVVDFIKVPTYKYVFDKETRKQKKNLW